MMEEDSKLKFSCDKFQRILLGDIPDIDPDEEILNKPISEPYPSLSILVQFASIVYTDNKNDTHDNYEKKLNLPVGWKLLTTACNDGWKNGYFGAALWSSSLQQVVVTHRGTKPTETGAMWTNLTGVVFKNDSYRMISAITFVDKVKCAVHEANKSSKRFHLSVTGHSLGGWLAQISGFSVKYLQTENGKFIKSRDQLNALHAHIVAFDSPGCKSMLDNIVDTYDFRYRRTVCLESLDISNYLSAPNSINTFGLHMGSIYRVMIDVSRFSKLPGKYTLAAHDIGNLVEAFKNNNKIYGIKDWPVTYVFTSTEYNKFRREVGSTNEYHLNPEKEDESSMEVRYKPEGSDNSGSLRIFSDDELKILHFWIIFKKESVRTIKMQTFLSKHNLGECKHLFEHFEIDDKNHTITCESKESLDMVVKRAKLLVRWFRQELMEAVDQQSREIPGMMYFMANRNYLDFLTKCQMSFRDSIGLQVFLESDAHRILHIETEDSELEMARLYNVFCQLRERSTCRLKDYLQNNNQTFVHWKQMVTLGGVVDCDHLYEVNFTPDNLLVIDCSSSTDTSLDLGGEKMFKQFMNNVKKKLILVSPRQSDSESFLKSFNVPVTKVPFKQVELIDLTAEAQTELFERKMLSVRGQMLSLADYAGIQNFSEFLLHVNTLIDTRRLKSIVIDQNYVIELKDPLLNHDDLGVHSALNRQVSVTGVSRILREYSSSALLVISGAERQETWRHLVEINEGAEERVISAENAEPLFKQLCREKPDNKICWLDVSAGLVCCKQMYEKDFYMGRKFCNRFIFNLNNIVNFLNRKDVQDVFIFQNISDKNHLMDLLSPEGSKEDILKSENIQIAVSAEQVDNIVKRSNHKPVHVLKYEGNGNSCLWLRSHGSLEGLRPYVTADTSAPIDEGDLCKIRQKVIIIADEPGMGKSTSLTSMTRLFKSAWVIRINLKDFLIPIQNLPPVLSLRSVTEFLLEEKFTEDSLLHGLLEFCLQHEHSRQVYLLFDGFDEIKEDSSKNINNQIKVLRLLQYLKNETTARVWVTTRFYLRKMLENGLTVFATTFQKVNEKQQHDYIVKFWRSHFLLELDSYGDADESKLVNSARDLYRDAKEALGTDVNRFMGILLQTRMLAEVFLQPVKDNVESKDGSSLKIENVFDLYQKFVSHKYNIYFNDKTALNAGMSGIIKYSNIEQITEKHRTLSLFTLFPKFAKENYDDIDIDWRVELNRVGLVQSAGCGSEDIEFSHRTLAEFFCADLAVQWLCKKGRYHGHAAMVDLLLTDILLQDSYEVIRTFINYLILLQPLSEDADKFSALKVSQLWCDKQRSFFNKNQETALHVAVEEKNDGIVDFLIGGLKSEPPQKTLIAFIAAHNEDGNTALGVAAVNAYDDESSETMKYTCNKIMKKIVQSVASCPYEVILELLLATYIQLRDNYSKETRLLTKYLEGEAVCSEIKKAFIRTMNIIQEHAPPFLAAVRGSRTRDVGQLYCKMENNTERYYILLARDDEGNTVLHLAAQDKNNEEHNKIQTQIIRILCDHNISGIGRTFNSWGETPLHCAASAGHLDIVEHFVNHGVYIDSLSLHGESALSAAACNGHLPIVKFLEEKGADVNSIDYDGSTPLSSAAEMGHLLVVEFLEKTGADIQSTDKQGNTPLSRAAKMGRLLVLNFLVKNGADVNCRDSEGNTPLSNAAEMGYLPVVEFLVQKGADINSTDKAGCTPLSRAAEMEHLPVVKFLVKKGADINSEDTEGYSVLSRAGKMGRLSIVQFLVEEGADIDSVDFEDMTAWVQSVDMKKHCIAEMLSNQATRWFRLIGPHPTCSDFWPAMQFLMKKGIEINSIHKKGSTVLSQVSEMGHFVTVEFLVENGADINSTDKDGRTALSLAACNRHLSVVEFLITKGADINSKDMAGWATLSEVAKMGHPAVMEFLSDKAADTYYPDIEHWTTLFLAAIMGWLPLLKFLIERGADINSTDEEGWTTLSRASKMGHLPVVEFLIERRADINSTNNEGSTALSEAVKTGRLLTVKFLVEKGANIHCTDKETNTPLIRAAEMGHLPVVEFLVEKGADINSKNVTGWTALSVANKFGHLPIMEFLVDKGADINHRDTELWTGMSSQFWQDRAVKLEFLKGDFFYTISDFWAAMYRPIDTGRISVTEFLKEEGADINSLDLEGETALTRAAKSGYLKGVMFLVGKGANINCTNNGGRTALSNAAEMGQLPTVKLLVEKEANINSSDDEGQTALSHAAYGGHLPVVEFLVEKGADINRTNNEGSTALSEAAEMGHLPVVEFLVEKGANINSLDKEGWTALFHAAYGGHLPVVEFLMENGAVINFTNLEGGTALSVAAKTGRLAMVESLAEEGADMNSADEKGWTALFHAVYNRHLPVVEFLLGKMVDIDSTDKMGRTALNLAACDGHFPEVKVLVETGADIGSTDKEGRTALYRAAEMGILPIVKFLVENGADINCADKKGNTALSRASELGRLSVVQFLKERMRCGK